MAGREGGKTICCLTVHVQVCESLRLSSDDVEASPLAESSFSFCFFFKAQIKEECFSTSELKLVISALADSLSCVFAYVRRSLT